jgi:hypothetical protein
VAAADAEGAQQALGGEHRHGAPEKVLHAAPGHVLRVLRGDAVGEALGVAGGWGLRREQRVGRGRATAHWQLWAPPPARPRRRAPGA